jgi:hypothetical protein
MKLRKVPSLIVSGPTYRLISNRFRRLSASTPDLACRPQHVPRSDGSPSSFESFAFPSTNVFEFIASEPCISHVKPYVFHAERLQRADDTSVHHVSQINVFPHTYRRFL